jgi:hypothetical protein
LNRKDGTPSTVLRLVYQLRGIEHDIEPYEQNTFGSSENGGTDEKKTEHTKKIIIIFN